MEYINDNIIEKGIDMDELGDFIQKKTGEAMESLPLEQLKKMVELFNNKGEENTGGETVTLEIKQEVKEGPTEEEIKQKEEEEKKKKEEEEKKLEEEKKKKEEEEAKKKQEEEKKRIEEEAKKKKEDDAKKKLEEEAKKKEEEQKKLEEKKKKEDDLKKKLEQYKKKKEEEKKKDEQNKKKEEKIILNKEAPENKKEEPNKDIKKEEPKKTVEVKKPEEKKKEEPNKKEEPKKKEEKPQEQSKSVPIPVPNRPSMASLNSTAPQNYEFDTFTQQNNKLLELSQNNTLITVTITDPKKEKSNFFSKNIYSYNVQCPELKSSVRRIMSDFEWLRNQLIIRYPLRQIPPMVKEGFLKQEDNIINKVETEELFEQRKIRYLTKFINSIIQKKILRTSPIFHEFLVLEDNKFKKYKSIVESKKYELEISLSNLITTKGKVQCTVDKKMIDGVNNLANKSVFIYELYNKIDASMNEIINNITNLALHMKEVSCCFEILKKNINILQCSNNENLKKHFDNYKKLFEGWSVSLKKQAKFFNEDFRENFNYMTMEFDSMNLLYKKYNEFKKEYEEFSSMINKRKEDLFSSKNYEKWGLQPGTEKSLNSFKNNKKEAFEYMLFRENLLLIEEKKRINITVYKMKKQFDKLMKMQSDKIQNLYDIMTNKLKIELNI